MYVIVISIIVIFTLSYAQAIYERNLERYAITPQAALRTPRLEQF